MKEQLSTVLGEHANGQLGANGCMKWGGILQPCLVQVLFNDLQIAPWYGLARRFDESYQPTWEPEELLAWIEALYR